MTDEGNRSARRIQDSLVDEYELLHAVEMGRKKSTRDQDEGFDPEGLRIDWEALDRAASGTTPVQWIERWVKATPGWLWLLTAIFTTLAAFGTFLWASHEFPEASVTQKLMLFGVCIVAFGLAGLLLALVATGLEPPSVSSPSPQAQLRIALPMVVAMLGAGSLAVYGGNLWITGTDDSLRKTEATLTEYGQEIESFRELIAQLGKSDRYHGRQLKTLIAWKESREVESQGAGYSPLAEQMARLQADFSSTVRDLRRAQSEVKSELTEQVTSIRERLQTQLAELEQNRVSTLASWALLEDKIEEFRADQTKLREKVEEIEARLKDDAPLTTRGFGIGECIELTVSGEPDSPRGATWSRFKALARLDGWHGNCAVWEPNEFETTASASIPKMESVDVLGNVSAFPHVSGVIDPSMPSSDLENLTARVQALESQLFLLRLGNESTVTDAKPPKPKDQ